LSESGCPGFKDLQDIIDKLLFDFVDIITLCVLCAWSVEKNKDTKTHRKTLCVFAPTLTRYASGTLHVNEVPLKEAR